MDDILNIFYARNETDRRVKQFCKTHGIEISKHPAGYDMIFLEFEHTEGEELEAVLMACASNATVYLMQLSHLGQGAKAKEMGLVLEAVQSPERDTPDYIDVDHNKMTATFVRTPNLGDVPYPVIMEPNLVVEFYAKN